MRQGDHAGMTRRNDADTNATEGGKPRRELPEEARGANETAIPEGVPDRMWGGPGLGLDCIVCGEPVSRDQTELELEFHRPDGKHSYHVHVPCFRTWELEQSRRGTAATTDPPALSGRSDCGNIRSGGFGGSNTASE